MLLLAETNTITYLCNMEEETWQERLNTEYRDLTEKVVKLDKALRDHKVPKESRSILIDQLAAMTKYQTILRLRITRI